MRGDLFHMMRIRRRAKIRRNYFEYYGEIRWLIYKELNELRRQGLPFK